METFTPWIVGPDTGVGYSVTVTVLFGSDDNRYNDTLTTQTRAVADLAGVPKEEMQTQFSLGQCFPNPFNAKTTMHFSVKQRARVSLKIYNVAGQLVRTLVNEELFPGTYTGVVWDGRDSSGNPIGSGVYLYNLNTPWCSETRKMVLLR
jgi:flagellar hook assembly protein FlgD